VVRRTDVVHKREREKRIGCERDGAIGSLFISNLKP